MIVVNGDIRAQGTQFSVCDIDIVIANIDIDAIRSYRASISSRSDQASEASAIERVAVDFSLGRDSYVTTPRIQLRTHKPEEEIGLGPACWLWDYLRRSGAGGFFLPLSGGADSASTCAIVGIMCHLVVEAVQNGDLKVLEDVRRVTRQTKSHLESLKRRENKARLDLKNARTEKEKHYALERVSKSQALAKALNLEYVLYIVFLLTTLYLPKETNHKTADTNPPIPESFVVESCIRRIWERRTAVTSREHVRFESQIRSEPFTWIARWTISFVVWI